MATTQQRYLLEPITELRRANPALAAAKEVHKRYLEEPDVSLRRADQSTTLLGYRRYLLEPVTELRR